MASPSRPKHEAEQPFNLNSPRLVKHTKLGSWDLYTQHNTNPWIPMPLKFDELKKIYSHVPYLSKTLIEIFETCWHLILLYTLTIILQSIIPSNSLW